MKYFRILMICLILGACSKNERLIYTDMPGVYFPDYTLDADSLVYSFRMKMQDVDTLYINVKLLGDLLKESGEYGVKVLPSSTAIEGKHYVAFPKTFTYAANQSMTSFPVIVLKPGKELDDKMVTLDLSLEATNTLALGYPNRLKMRLMITNQLVKPSYWAMPLSLYFGEYSQVKHQRCIMIMGHDFPLTESELLDWGGLSAYSYWMQQGRAVCEYYATHTEYDENGNLITVWNPF